MSTTFTIPNDSYDLIEVDISVNSRTGSTRQNEMWAYLCYDIIDAIEQWHCSDTSASTDLISTGC
jgi:hypothetical protein